MTSVVYPSYMYIYDKYTCYFIEAPSSVVIFFSDCGGTCLKREETGGKPPDPQIPAGILFFLPAVGRSEAEDERRGDSWRLSWWHKRRCEKFSDP